MSTVILTIPIIGALALATGEKIQIALSPAQTVMMFLSLLVASIGSVGGADPMPKEDARASDAILVWTSALCNAGGYRRRYQGENSPCLLRRGP